ncbi:MAG: protein kinase [Deltaproteobacteria bacterium]|nr:MAG: protein kinase [Deltaproteobacteria bacterium]
MMGDIDGGGMGDIVRVWDERLNRSSAMKIIRADKVAHQRAVDRFIREARTTGLLQHPGIVPVHDMGQLPDGRWWFTMQEVIGRTFEEAMAHLHAAATSTSWPTHGDGSTFRRLVDALFRVCQTLAYAHAEGYIHRDVKPENIMIGRFGEVVLLDWGLGKLVASMVEDFDVDDTEPSVARVTATRAGGVLGSPPYMAPEQARGDVASVGPPADVYALGATLYHLLTGRPPYRGRTGRDVVERVKAGPPPPVVRAAKGRLPAPDPELAAICSRAMAREPGDRYAHAGELARALEEWLDGTRRIEEAALLVDDARKLWREAGALQQRAVIIEQQARRRRMELPRRPKEADQVAVWELEDEALGLRGRADQALAEVEARLSTALTLAPRHHGAHELLADLYKDRLIAADESGDETGARRWETLLRAHDRGRHLRWLQAGGLLTLYTDPPGAEVVLYREVERQRRFVPVRARVLGRTPLEAVEVPRGQVQIVVQHEGYHPAVLPLHIRRGERVDFVPPGEDAPAVLRLLSEGSLGPGEVYVPGGWCPVGGDEQAMDGIPAAQVWIDGFVITRFHVTVGEYLAYLNELAAEGRWDLVEAAGPRMPASMGTLPLWRRTDAGRVAFDVAEGLNSRLDTPDVPMTHLSWRQAMAYAAWRARRDGVPWRLPHDLEWEKAARGPQGRLWPWGRDYVAGRACIGEDYEGTPVPCRIDEYPGDVSVYGVRHTAGCVRTFCANTYRRVPVVDGDRVDITDGAPPESPYRMARGGSMFSRQLNARLAGRFAVSEETVYANVGIRLARSVPARLD